MSVPSAFPHSHAPADANERAEALGWVLGPGRSSTSIEQLDALLQTRGCPSDGIRISRGPTGDPVACVVVPGPGHVGALLLSPLPGPGSAAAAAHAAADAVAACRWDQIRLIQALLDPADTLRKASLEQAGLQSLAVLHTMERTLPRRKATKPDLGSIRLEPCLLGDAHHVAQLMVGTYADTLDCPGLYGLRDPMDTLHGHLAAGTPIPELWCIVHVDGRDAGVLFVADQQNVCDLVYVGLLPFARGRGIGRLLMQTLVHQLDATQRNRIRLSVDQSNTPALALYASLGFNTLSRSLALIATVAPVQVPPMN